MSSTHPIRIIRASGAAMLLAVVFNACVQSPSAPGEIERDGTNLETSESISPVLDVGPASHDDSFHPTGRALVPAGPNFVVDDDGADCSNADFSTIQAAVDAAALTPGKDKIEICAGTYPEDVLVGSGNPLDIRGAGVGVVVVTGVPGSGAPIIHITNAGEVKIKDLTVDGQFNRNGASVYGIRYEDTDADIKDIRVANIMNAARSNQGVTLGVLVLGAGSYKAKVHKSTFEEFGRVGILAHGDVDADIKDNVVTGPGETTNWAPNGIQVSGGALADVQKNTVSDADHTCQCAAGIILFQAAPGVKVKQNDVSSSDIGIVIQNTDGASVEKNEVDAGDQDGIRADVANNSQIKDNSVTGGGDDGIQVSNGSTGIEVEKNEVRNSGDDGYVATSSTNGNFFEKNVASGSGDLSCNDTSAGGGTAGTANTWQKNEGEKPSNPPGICP